MALRRVLRQDPDVILVGEIRDTETLEVALKAADTGHLVFSTLHTTDATQTINRVLSFYAPHQQNEVRFTLASALAAVVSKMDSECCDALAEEGLGPVLESWREY